MVTHRLQGSTEFRFHKPGAREVFLVGDFNELCESRVPMRRDDSGEWFCNVELSQGVYRFRYLADGEWHTERDAAGLGWAPFHCNSLTVMAESHEPASFVG